MVSIRYRIESRRFANKPLDALKVSMDNGVDEGCEVIMVNEVDRLRCNYFPVSAHLRVG